MESLPEATLCKHGEVKFIVVPSGAHVPPHTGQTNTVLEVMVGVNLGDGELSVRVAEETRLVCTECPPPEVRTPQQDTTNYHRTPR